MRWVDEEHDQRCPDCGEVHPELGEEVELRTTKRLPSEAALSDVREGRVPLPTPELRFTAQFTSGRNRPLTEEEKRGG